MAPHGLGRAQAPGGSAYSPSLEKIESKIAPAKRMPCRRRSAMACSMSAAKAWPTSSPLRPGRGAGTVRTWTPSGTPGPKAGVISATAVEWP